MSTGPLMRPAVFAVITLFCFCAAASAGVIQSSPVPTASGPGLGFANVAAIFTPTPNNDNVPGPLPDNNIVVPLKRFDSNNYIDIEFKVSSSDGVTEYLVTEFVDNNTGSPWASYTMSLGFGVGPQFQLSAANDGLDFDSPTYDTPPTAAAFSSVNTSNPDILVFSGGSQGSGAQQYQFRIDVPDGLSGGAFTLRQIPTAVPEPNTIWIGALAFVRLAGLRRRRL